MLRVKVKKGQNVDKALKLFKRKFKNTGILKELRERQKFTKKSRKRRLMKDKAIYKQKYLNNLDNE
jgi:small subunit ribosomal protein S21